MSRYAVDTDRRALVVSWPTGIGDVASTVSRLQSSGEEEDTRELADALTTLSAALWRTYTHPASAAGTPDTNGEVWRREQERDAFDQVVPALDEIAHEIVDDGHGRILLWSGNRTMFTRRVWAECVRGRRGRGRRR